MSFLCAGVLQCRLAIIAYALGYTGGVVNYFVTTLLHGPRIPGWAIRHLFCQRFHYHCLVTFGFQAGVIRVHNIPETLYEAAKIDGANHGVVFLHHDPVNHTTIYSLL